MCNHNLIYSWYLGFCLRMGLEQNIFHCRCTRVYTLAVYKEADLHLNGKGYNLTIPIIFGNLATCLHVCRHWVKYFGYTN